MKRKVERIDKPLLNNSFEYTPIIAPKDSAVKLIHHKKYPKSRPCLWCNETAGFYTCLRVNQQKHYADIKCNSCHKGNGYLSKFDYLRQIALGKCEEANNTRLNGGVA